MLVAERYDFRLYTRADEHVPPEIPRFPQVDAMTGQLKVFSASRINLNITLRSIETGVPLRVFDIMSRAGFALTDYRADAQELFEEDREIVMYKTPEEMVDKIDFYLQNETKRRQIGLNAYEKVKKCFSYESQLQKIMKILYPGS
jgi:spore maturation protein CgeB